MRRSEAFGPYLRSVRVRRHIALDTIARETKVPVEIWEAMEDDEFDSWPNGVVARGWIAAYARVVGLDPDDVINEFCRRFPQGDRRRDRVIVNVASALGQPAVWQDDWRGTERRAPLMRLRELRRLADRERRWGTAIDIAATVVVGAVAAAVGRVPLWMAVGASGILWFAVCARLKQSVGTLVVRWCSSRPSQSIVIPTAAEQDRD
jgi:hypothetical protein